MLASLGIGFTTPWLLAALVALPVLWVLLRAVPPAPIRRLFPGVVLLLGLRDDDSQSDKTPWWLLVLRTLAIAALIVGFAGPVLNPREKVAGAGPLLIVLDGSWADARDWSARMDRVGAALDDASRSARAVAIVTLNDPPPGALPFQAADSWRSRLPGIQPKPWMPDGPATQAWADALTGGFETFWLSDGVARDSRAGILAALKTHGAVRVFESPRPVYGLRPALFEDGAVKLSVVRARSGAAGEVTVAAHGLDPGGVDRVLAQAVLSFAPGEGVAETALSLPAELRNRLSRFSILGVRSAGAVSLGDDALKRREVALVAGQADREGLQLLSPTHFLQQALAPTADLIEGTIGDILLANPDVIVLADIAKLAPAEAAGITDWVTKGGLLLRFAGPRLAGSDISRGVENPLMPVRLRAGGRTIGGAMSWGEPKSLRAFQQGSPFFGLDIPAEVTVNAQVLAEPDPTLSARVIAALSDGTPLVTRKRIGQGQVVLFHVTANAEWSTLPLSGLFVQMLERLAVSTAPARPDAADLAGTTWEPVKVLDAYGAVQEPGNTASVSGEAVAAGDIGAGLPPGLYSGLDRRIALNVIGPETLLAPASWPADVAVEGFGVLRETALKAALLSLALILLGLDVIASLWLSGRLRGPRGGAGVATMLAALVFFTPQQGRAQSDAFALEATAQVVLAHVITGDKQLDDMAQAGLRGLSDALFARTSVEPAEPIAVNLETDELSFFPFLYWPVTPDQPQPSAEAYARLNRYLRTGGMILFDTRDANVASFGTSSPNGRKLQQLASPLDIPPLEPVPSDHVLTRTFYLLQDFPGRFASRDVWVEAAPADAKQIEGMPFRNLNDNVTPVVIGGNDWAAAWAVDPMGNLMFPVGRGSAGARQREIAYRFGINLIMYVLTGNYKSDQVHVPALLDRLGQ
jgi:Domain of unknown function (DUF4159)/Aerotolerance regulator N-terminal